MLKLSGKNKNKIPKKKESYFIITISLEELIKSYRMTKNNSLVKILKGTNPNLLSLCILLLRCTIGSLLFIAGSGKLLGWFGGYGMEATLQGFSKHAGCNTRNLAARIHGTDRGTNSLYISYY